MLPMLTQWQRLRIAETLWNQNEERIDFRWFHEKGLPTPFVLDQVKIEVSHELSSEVLLLRLQAAQFDGRLRHIHNPEQLRDDFDQDALHINLILRNQLVASGRLVFLRGDPLRSEINKSLVPLPELLMSDPGMVEISRVCTHPDFRRGHLLTLLLSECARQAFQRGGHWLLGYCVGSLVPVYQRFAGEQLPFSGKHPLYEGKDSFVVRIPLDKVMRGECVPYLAWARFIAPYLRDMKSHKSRLEGWPVWFKALGAQILRPCLNEALRLTLLRST